jgi:hypothetical protein
LVGRAVIGTSRFLRHATQEKANTSPFARSGLVTGRDVPRGSRKLASSTLQNSLHSEPDWE